MSNSYLSSYDKKILLDRLKKYNPELFYDNLSHNKVLQNLNPNQYGINNIDAYILIPHGYRALVWYTYFKKNNVSILINFNKFNKIHDMRIYPSCFNNDIAINNSIFIGYQCENTEKVENMYGNYKQIFFACTDIIRYKGKNLYDTNFKDKFKYYNDLFRTDIRQLSYCKYTLIFALAIIQETYDTTLAAISQASYRIASVEYIQFNKPKTISTCNISSFSKIIYPIQNPIQNPIRNTYHTKSAPEAIFKVKASIEEDIYNLYFYDNASSDNFHNIAFINTYKKSVFMNTLFRNIKENKNLDLLEESDDDEDFENISEDKYIDINKSLNMRCVYNVRFKKWEPLEVSNTNKIINKNELYNIESKFYERNQKK